MGQHLGQRTGTDATGRLPRKLGGRPLNPFRIDAAAPSTYDAPAA
ncbi:hypothetical protein ACIOEW_40725 [Streptomyces sp. NPDC087901]